MNSYEEHAKRLWDAGAYADLLDYAGRPGRLCACLGPKNGDEFCPCQMRYFAVSKNYAMVKIRKLAGLSPTLKI